MICASLLSILRRVNMKILNLLNAAVIGTLMSVASFGAQAAPCALTDVSLTINGVVYAPTACADGVSQGGGPLSETNSLSSKLGYGSNGLTYLDKSDDAGTPTGIGGVAFTVSASGGNDGTWSVSWAEAPGTPNLPLYIDFAVALFGGNNGAGYYFEDVLLTSSPTSGSGTYDINFLNNGGQQPKLSHLLLAGRDARECTTCGSTDVPLPGTALLLGLGLGALGFTGARRGRKA